MPATVDARSREPLEHHRLTGHLGVVRRRADGEARGQKSVPEENRNPSIRSEGTTVNPPQGTTITCPNHGSQFDSTTGAVKRGPATSPLRAVSVKVDGTNVVLA